MKYNLLYNFIMNKFFESLLDWIYKKKCYFCKSSKESVKMCSKCYATLDFLPAGVNRIIEGKNVYCAGIYSKNLQKLIRGLKYHNQPELAFYLAKFMNEYLNINKTDFEIVPVPIFSQREKKRKYNHMNLVGDELAALSGNICNKTLVSRIKDTKPQYKLKKFERIKNLENAFKVNKNNYQGKTILLIDDICTTGSTFQAIIKELEKNGIKNIICFAATTPFET